MSFCRNSNQLPNSSMVRCSPGPLHPIPNSDLREPSGERKKEGMNYIFCIVKKSVIQFFGKMKRNLLFWIGTAIDGSQGSISPCFNVFGGDQLAVTTDPERDVLILGRDLGSRIRILRTPYLRPLWPGFGRLYSSL